ncbi:MAG: DUF3822 family protein [Muribaculaceae bacterium]|nr:DUF3822 family protein [Muribaculaceae bacterium]
MYTLTAADFADTGQWRLLLKIGVTGMEALLENTLHPEIEPQPLCGVKWELNKDALRQNIEDAVYNNPRLLDDFATRIILYDPRTLFIPTVIAEERAGAEEELYQKVYVAEPHDIMTDYDRDLTAAWSMAPGVKGFLMRTFPGARITCNLMDQVRELRKNNEGLTIYAIGRPGEADIIMLEGRNLISASTHEWVHTDDIAYLVVNLTETYGYKLEEVRVVLTGAESDTQAWKHIAGRVGRVNS